MNTGSKIRVAIEPRFLEDRVAMYIVESSNDLSARDVYRQAEIIFRERPLGEIATPTLGLSRETAQQLFDELHRLGFRPMNEEAPARLAAVEAHLMDAREFSYRLLDLVERGLLITSVLEETREVNA